MNNKDLLKSMGSIDDKYIDEASLVKSEGKLIKGKFRFAKYVKPLAALLAICITGSIFLNPGMFKKYANLESKNEYNGNDSYNYEPSNNYSKPGFSKDENQNVQTASNFSRSSVKLIYKGDIVSKTSEFDKACTEIKKLVDDLNGYIESQRLENDSYYSGSSYKNIKYIIRIPSENYNKFIEGSQGVLTIKSLEQTVDNVGEVYFEIEQKLETLYIKLGRLQDLLKNASSMSDIIEIESKISDCEYEINMYKTDLNRYDSLIDYSTITLSIQEVERPGSGIEVKENFFTRFFEYLADGFRAAGDNLANFFYFIAYNAVGIIVIAVAVVLAIKYKWFSKLMGVFRKTK